MGKIVVLVAAAGASSRMRGVDKLLEPVGGEALLTRQARVALSTGADVLITLPEGNEARLAALEEIGNGRLSIVALEDAAEGIAASIRAAGRWAQEMQAAGLMIMLADMPGIEADDLERMITAFETMPDRVVRAVAEDGTHGHPVIFPQRLFEALQNVAGDTGARTVLAGEDVATVAIPGEHAITDLDTPEDWAKWRLKSGL